MRVWTSGCRSSVEFSSTARTALVCFGAGHCDVAWLPCGFKCLFCSVIVMDDFMCVCDPSIVSFVVVVAFSVFFLSTCFYLVNISILSYRFDLFFVPHHVVDLVM